MRYGTRELSIRLRHIYNIKCSLRLAHVRCLHVLYSIHTYIHACIHIYKVRYVCTRHGTRALSVRMPHTYIRIWYHMYVCVIMSLCMHDLQAACVRRGTRVLSLCMHYLQDVCTHNDTCVTKPCPRAQNTGSECDVCMRHLFARADWSLDSLIHR